MEVTLDKFGRILIPKRLRKILGIKSGQKLELRITGKGISATPVESPDIGLVEVNGFLILRTDGGDIDNELLDVVQRDREERIEKLIKPSK